MRAPFRNLNYTSAVVAVAMLALLSACGGGADADAPIAADAETSFAQAASTVGTVGAIRLASSSREGPAATGDGRVTRIISADGSAGSSAAVTGQCDFAVANPFVTASGGINGSEGGIRDSEVVTIDGVPHGIFVGRFNAINVNGTSLPRNAFYVVNLATGGLSEYDFDPQVGITSVEAISCEGTKCAVTVNGPTFRGVGVGPVAVFDLRTGLVDSGFQSPKLDIGAIRAIHLSGRDVVIGGTFTSFRVGKRRVFRSYIASLSSRSGALSSWAPQPDNQVYSVRVAPTGRVLAAGAFNTVNQLPRQGFVEFDNGAVTSFNPAPPPEVTGVTGYDVLFYKSNYVLLGGYAQMAGRLQKGISMVTPAGADSGTDFGTAVNSNFFAISGKVVGDDLYLTFVSSTGFVGGLQSSGFARLSLLLGLAMPTSVAIQLRDVHVNFPQATDQVQAIPGVGGSCPTLILSGFQTLNGFDAGDVAKLTSN